MATKPSPNRASGVNNTAGSGPRPNIGAPQPASGGRITTPRVPAAATYAGHRQVNPGSKKK